MKQDPAYSFQPRVSFAASAEKVRDMVVASAHARGEVAEPAVAIPMRAESKPFMGWDWEMPMPKARVSKARASGISVPAAAAPKEPRQRHPRRATAASTAAPRYEAT